MGNRQNLDELKSLASRTRAAAGKNIKELSPEIRSDVKWAAVLPAAQNLAPCPPLQVAWRYGVPWKDVTDFHKFLANLEATIKQNVDGNSNNNVKYLGTYVNLDGGNPMYETLWGYWTDIEAFDWNTLLGRVPANVRKAAKDLREYWARDPSRSEHRYGLAQNYRVGDKLPKDPFLD